ncbi:MAG: hypothetical protein A2Y38_16790 [Spirochaetes bacterium GWB1_59_5]|nr:MAG: hypothetical protein A2Y38_16790 [Spirochaetes bacterium GWB1_59_5]
MATAGQIKLIHCLKSALALDDAAYRAILGRYGVDSSTQLTERMAADLVEDLEAKAVASGVWKKRGAPKRAGRRPFQGKAPASKEQLLKKVEALLADAGRPWAYADGMAKHMFKLDSVRFADADQLRRIVAALVYDAKRRAKREG